MTNYFIDWENGSDCNDGLTIKTAFKSPKPAYAIIDLEGTSGDFIYIMPEHTFPFKFGEAIDKIEGATYICDHDIADPDGWYISGGKVYVSEDIFDNVVTP
jgi:hypothetical protein